MTKPARIRGYGALSPDGRLSMIVGVMEEDVRFQLGEPALREGWTVVPVDIRERQPEPPARAYHTEVPER